MCSAGGCLEVTPIPAPSIATPAGATTSSIGASTELDMHGQGEARRAPILTREDRTQRKKFCVFSSSIRFHSRAVVIDVPGWAADVRFVVHTGLATGRPRCRLMN